MNNLNLKVGDIVKMKNNGIPDQRIVGVYPMNNIPHKDRVDVTDADKPDYKGYIGIPISWIKEKI